MKLYIYYETINTHNSDGTEHYRVALVRTVRLFPRSVKSPVIVRVRSSIVFFARRAQFFFLFSTINDFVCTLYTLTIEGIVYFRKMAYRINGT